MVRFLEDCFCKRSVHFRESSFLISISAYFSGLLSQGSAAQLPLSSGFSVRLLQNRHRLNLFVQA